MKTRITQLFNIKHPIIQGGMHYVGFAELAAAVSNAGAMGIIETSSGELEVIREEIATDAAAHAASPHVRRPTAARTAVKMANAIEDAMATTLDMPTDRVCRSLLPDIGASVPRAAAANSRSTLTPTAIRGGGGFRRTLPPCSTTATTPSSW